METPAHAARAEQLGYERAWLYDSPALYPDVWIQLARAADATSTIGLGPGVLVPSLRHPMATASAIGTLAAIAGPDRVAIAVGSGFTGRFTLGQKPVRWADVEAWVVCVRALLRGETVTWEGGRMRMLQPRGFGPARPIEVPFLIGASGPKGVAVGERVAEGLLVTGRGAGAPTGLPQTALFTGTVLDDGEAPDSERALAAGGHAAAVGFHFLVEHGRRLDALPGAAEWAAVYDALPAAERHLALHDLHLIGVNERDAPFVTSELMELTGAAFSPARLRERLAGLEEAGVSEVAYQPAGPEIESELERFATAVRG
jgi:5,10-methylenetetrahydromethanopterin reductase